MSPGRWLSASVVSESSSAGLNRTRRVFSGWAVKPYLIIRLGNTSMIRRASSSRETPMMKSSA